MDAAPVPVEIRFDAAPGAIVLCVSSKDIDGVWFIAAQDVDTLCEQAQKAKAHAEKLASGLQVPDQHILGPNGLPMAVVPPSPEVQEHVGRLRSVGEATAGDPVAEHMEADDAPPEEPSEKEIVECEVNHAVQCCAKHDHHVMPHRGCILR